MPVSIKRKRGSKEVVEMRDYCMIFASLFLTFCCAQTQKTQPYYTISLQWLPIPMSLKKFWGDHIGFQGHAPNPQIKIVLLGTLSLCKTLVRNWIAPVVQLRSSPSFLFTFTSHLVHAHSQFRNTRPRGPAKSMHPWPLFKFNSNFTLAYCQIIIATHSDSFEVFTIEKKSEIIFILTIFFQYTIIYCDLCA